MNVSNWKKGLYLLFFFFIAPGALLMGCGDDELEPELQRADSAQTMVRSAERNEYVGTWRGTMVGVLQGMQGVIEVTLSNTGNSLSGSLDVTNAQNTPADVTIAGMVGTGDNNPFDGVYTFALVMNDNPPPLPCIGWGVTGVGILSKDRTELNLICLGVFCGNVAALPGYSVGTLARQN